MKKLLLLLPILFVFALPSSASAENKIINGKEARAADWPWIAYLSSYNRKEQQRLPFCSGQLVAKQWVLTAAHCLDGNGSIQELRAAVGRTDTSSSTGAEMDLELAGNYFFHPRWHQKSYCCQIYDMVLLRLPAEVSIRPIQIAQRLPAAGSKIRIAGFGLLRNSPALRSTKLMETEARFYRYCRFDPKKPGVNYPQFFCNKFRNSSTCYGDSGGPVVFGGKLIGINAFMYKDCPAGTQAWSTDTVDARNWISRVTSTGRDRLAINYHLARYSKNRQFRNIYFGVSQSAAQIRLSFQSDVCLLIKGKTRCIGARDPLALSAPLRTSLNRSSNTIPFRARKSCLRATITAVTASGNQTVEQINQCGLGPERSR